MKYTVFAFYPNLGIKVRTTQYDSKDEMFEYCGGLQLTDTPYVAFSPQLKVIDIKTNEFFTSKRMGEWIDKYVNTEGQE